MTNRELCSPPFAFITLESFSLNPCTLTIQWGPFSLEMLNAVEIYMLMEAFRLSFAHVEGPLPNIFHTWGWGIDLFLSQLAPRYSPFIAYSNFWLELIRKFWYHSLSEPLAEVISETLRKDLLELISLHANLPVDISYHGTLTTAYNDETHCMVPRAHITFSRTDFSHPQVISNLGTIGLKLREGYDAKRRPRSQWTKSSYLKQHKERHAEYLRFIADEPGSSSTSDPAKTTTL